MKEMTSKERVFAALELKEPDRVPVYEGSVNAKVIDAICPGGTYEDFAETVGLDIVRINYPYDVFAGVEFVDEERRIYRDKFGVLRQFTSEAASYPLKGPIESEEDLKAYRFPDPAADGRLPIIAKLRERFGNDKPIGWVSRDAFILAANLRGMENLLMDYAVNPHFAHEITEMGVDYEMRLTELALKNGADIITLADDYAWKKGPLMSPGHFREFILPGLTKMVKFIKENGAYCIKHTDGNIWPILEMIVEAGIDAINPLEPIAGMEIGRVKAAYGHKVCLVGNIDCGYILSQASLEEVREAVRECIAKASPGGGHIISSSNSLHSSIRPENYLAMIEATRELGRYPIAT